MPLGYRQVKDLYDTLADAGVVTKSLPEWSQEMNESMGTDLYSEGLTDNWVKQASVGVDKLLEATGLPAVSEDIGRSIGSVVGNPEAGAAIGKSLPRAGASMLPFLIPGAGAVLGPASMAASAGTEAYTATGSPAAGVTSGLLNLVMPAAAGKATQVALGRMGGEFVKEAGRFFPTSRTMGVAGEAVGQLAAGGLGVAADVGSQLVAGEGVHISPTEQLLNLTLGQAPFAGMYLGKGGRVALGGRTTRAHIDELRSASKLAGETANAAENNAELSDKPREAEVPGENAVPPETDLNAIRQEKDQLKEEGGKQAQDKWNTLTDEENAKVTAGGLIPGNLAGSKLDSKVPRRLVFGEEVQTNEDGSWRAVRVANDPRNGDLAGKLIGYDTAHEMRPTPTGEGANLTFSIPERFHTELTEGEVPGRFNADSTLQQAEAQLSAAKGLDEMQGALVKLNAVRKAYGHEAVDDVTLAGKQETWELGSQRDAIRAAINETRRLAGEQDRSVVVDGLYKRKHELELQQEEARLGGLAEDVIIRQQEIDETQKQIDAVSVKNDATEVNDVPPLVEGVGAQIGPEPKPLPKSKLELNLEELIHKTEAQLQDSVIRGVERNITRDRLELESLKDQLVRAQESKAKIGPEPKPLPKVPDDARGAPVKQFLYEQASHITQSTRNKADRNAFLAYVKTGVIAPEVAAKPHVKRWQAELNKVTQSRPPTPRTAAEPLFQARDEHDQAFVDGVGKTGTDLLNRLRQSQNSMVQQVVSKLERFGEALGRVSVGVHDIDGPSVVRKHADRTTGIYVASHLRHASPEAQELVLAHEALHGASAHELERNPVAARELEILRNKVADRLPPELRNAIQATRKSGWYENYVTGKAKWADLVKMTGSDENARLTYGLLNNDEFLSQGFTDKGLQDFMKSKGVFGRFSEWISKLLGLDVKPSDFEQFLSASDKVLGNGDFFASLHNYGERHFENKGLSPEDARSQTSRAIGAVTNLKYGESSADAMIRGVLGQRGTNPVLKQSEAKLAKYMQNPPETAAKAFAEAKVTNPDELLSGMIEGRVDSGTLKILDPEVTDYLYDKVRDAREVLGMLDSATTKGVENYLGVDASVGEPVRAALGKLDKFTKAEKELIKSTSDIQGLNAINPDGYLNKAMNPGGALAGPEPLYVAPENVGKSNWFKETAKRIEEWFATPAYWARESRAAAEFATKTRQLAANIRKSANSSLELLGLDLKTGQFDKTILESTKNPKIADAVSQWMYQNNEVGRKVGSIERLSRDSKYIKPILEKLTPAERVVAEETVGRMELATKHMNEQIAGDGGFLENTAVNYGARIIANVTKLKAEQNLPFAQTMLEKYLPRTDPQTKQPIPVDPMVQQAQIDNIAQILGPKAFAELSTYMQGQAQNIDMHRTFFTNHPAWATHRAYGKYDVTYNKGGRTVYTRVNSKAEAIALAGGEEHIVKDSFKPSKQSDDTYAMMWGEKEIAILEGIENRNNAILDQYLSEDERLEMRMLSPSEQMRVEMAERQGVPEKPGLGKRGFTKGEEHFPWFRNNVEWITQTASYHSRQLLRAQSRNLINEPELMARPDLQAQMRKHVENTLRSDPEATRDVNRFMSTWFLGANPASAIMNGTQMLIRGAAEMTNLTGNPFSSYKRILAATKDSLEFHNTKSGDKDSRFGWLKHKMDEDGISSVYDAGDVGKDDAAMELKRRLYGLGPQTKAQQFAAVNDQINQKAMWMFKKVEKANNVVAMIAGFDYFKPKLAKEMPHLDAKQLNEMAYEKAMHYNQSVNDIGGKANRSIGIFSGRDDFSKSAAMIGTSMQTYSIGTMGQIISYIKKGGFKVDGLKPGSEAFKANMALTQLLAVQTFAAGALGLPFVSGMMAVLDQAFPDLEVNKNVRSWANELFGGDEMMGSPIADAAMNGIPSMFGWDMQSRLSMGNMMPGVSELNGFQPEAMIGPAFSIGKQAVSGGLSLAKGEFSRAAGQLAPPFVKKIVNFALDGFRIRDYNDKPMFDATGGEVAGMLLGFQPTRVSQENVANRMATNAQKVENERKKKYYTNMADYVLKGQFAPIKQDLLGNEKYSTTEQRRAAANSIVDAAVEMQFPRDLRRGGGASEEYARTLRMFNLNPSLPSETARLQFKARAMQEIGFPVKRQDTQKAMLMDQLRLQQPHATRSELMRQAEAALGRKVVEPVAY